MSGQFDPISGFDRHLFSQPCSVQARIWICAVGFSILFGPILAKTFRVYYIFRSVKLKKKVCVYLALYAYCILSSGKSGTVFVYSGTLTHSGFHLMGGAGGKLPPPPPPN